MLQRRAQERLERWLVRPQRKPLVVRGARQVGKSTLVRAFARARGLVLREVNLERHRDLAPLFETNDGARVLGELAHLDGKGPMGREGNLLFLDEVQAVPAALQCLRYLHEDEPSLPVVAAGSLLEFALAEGLYSVPVGRLEYLFLGPMTFEEVLLARGEQPLLELLATWVPDAPFAAVAHERLLEAQRRFLLVGGMPEAVQAHLDTDDFVRVGEVHASILDTYRDDFTKYGSRGDLRRLQRMFEHVPASLGRKLKYVNVDPLEQARDLARALDMLTQAQVVIKVCHTDATGLPLGATTNPRVFKAFFLDVGLAAHLCGVRDLTLERLRHRDFVNEGPLAEQFIAQHLAFFGDGGERPCLFYWVREGRRGNAEVDFVVPVDERVVPVEVKAGKSGALRSLHQFVHDKGHPRAVRLDANPPSRQRVAHSLRVGSDMAEVEFELLSLPLYAVGQIRRLCRAW